MILLKLLAGILVLFLLVLFSIFIFATLPSLWASAVMYSGLVVISLFIYFLPSVIAAARLKKNTLAIFALNLLVGWTFIGWVICFIWSLTKD